MIQCTAVFTDQGKRSKLLVCGCFCIEVMLTGFGKTMTKTSTCCYRQELGPVLRSLGFNPSEAEVNSLLEVHDTDGKLYQS